MQIKRISAILKKEIDIELRQQFAMGGVFLFAATVIFLIYKSFNNIPPREWTIILWIVILFAGINAAVKSFLQEKRETYLYYYTVLDPVDLVIAKLIYNTIFLTLIFVGAIFFMTLFAGFPIKDLSLFLGSSLLGIFGIAIVFTFVSLLATVGNSSSTLMSILALPLVLPILLLMLKTSAVSARLITDTSVDQDIIMVAAIDSIFLGAILLLFPGLWRS